jgi:predicted TIM-barrel fold metal-dependent hydrolase
LTWIALWRLTYISTPGHSAVVLAGAVCNDEMLQSAARHPDVFIPFVMIDVWREHAGADEAQRLIAAGARGFKFHPPVVGTTPTISGSTNCMRSSPRPGCPPDSTRAI